MNKNERYGLGVLASTTAAMEATQTEVTDVKITITERLCRGNVCLTIPLNDAKHLDNTRIGVDQLQVVGDELQIDLNVKVDIRNLATNQNQSDTIVTQSNDDEEQNDTAGEANNESDPRGQTQSSRRAKSNTVELNEKREAVATADKSTDETISSVGTDTDELSSESDWHRYRDPEKLAAVYDENLTFREMKEALDTDVTAQTVRKYMIKYGIHEPETRPDRMLELIRSPEFEPIDNEQSNQTDQTDESDADSS